VFEYPLLCFSFCLFSRENSLCPPFLILSFSPFLAFMTKQIHGNKGFEFQSFVLVSCFFPLPALSRKLKARPLPSKRLSLSPLPLLPVVTSRSGSNPSVREHVPHPFFFPSPYPKFDLRFSCVSPLFSPPFVPVNSSIDSVQSASCHPSPPPLVSFFSFCPKNPVFLLVSFFPASPPQRFYGSGRKRLTFLFPASFFTPPPSCHKRSSQVAPLLVPALSSYAGCFGKSKH